MKGIKKLPLAAAIAVLSASANAELVALDEEVMGSMTGQAGITIESEVQATIDNVTYTDSGNALQIEGIKLGNNGGAFTQTVDIDVVSGAEILAREDALGDAAGAAVYNTAVSDRAAVAEDARSAAITQYLADNAGSVATDQGAIDAGEDAYNDHIANNVLVQADIEAAGKAAYLSSSTAQQRYTRAAGDAIRLTVGDLNMDAEIGAIRAGTNSNSIGSVQIDDISLAGSTTYVYALNGTNGIGVDAVVDQSIGRIKYTDQDYNIGTGAGTGGTAAAVADAVGEGNGSIQIHGVDISAINMEGTEIHILSSGEIANGLPGVDIKANGNDVIRVKTADINSGSITVQGIQIGSTEFTSDSLGYADTQITNAQISSSPDQATADALEARRTAALGVANETVGGAIINDLRVQGGDVYIYTEDGNEGIRIKQTVDVGADVTYVSGVASQYRRSAADGSVVDADSDAVGSFTADDLRFVAGAQDVAIDVVPEGIQLGTSLTNASLTVGALNLGNNSMGSLSVTGINVPVNNITITAH